MAQAKQPQDKKPKKDAPRETVVDGVKVTIDPDALDDFELLDDFSRMQNGDGTRVTSAFRRMFGDDSERMLDELREPSGRVKLTRASQFMLDVMKELAPSA